MPTFFSSKITQFIKLSITYLEIWAISGGNFGLNVKYDNGFKPIFRFGNFQIVVSHRLDMYFQLLGNFSINLCLEITFRNGLDLNLLKYERFDFHQKYQLTEPLHQESFRIIGPDLHKVFGTIIG